MADTHVNRTPLQLLWASGIERLDDFEFAVCARANRLGRQTAVRSGFSLVSRLGDGIAWYLMLVLLPVIRGAEALGPVLQMGVTALVGVAIYKVLKNRLVRERPYARAGVYGDAVEALAVPLDRYSFPSGHTLHAACFTLMLYHYFPELMPLVVPFAVSVAVSRVVLGLHYPSDVAAGAALGVTIAGASLVLMN